jgi:competence protein ComEA
MLGFTKEEQGIVLFLVCSLLVGSTVRLYQHFTGDRQVELKAEVSPSFIEEFRKRAEEIDAKGQLEVAEPSRLSPKKISRPYSAGTNQDDINASVSNNQRQANFAKEATARKFLIDINAANLEELQSIPRVGPVLAQRIIDYRNQIGRFNSVEELTEVSGIGPATLEKMRPYIFIN